MLTIMWIGRRPDNTVYGIWLKKQPNDEFHLGLEEVSVDHPDVVKFKNKTRTVFVDPRDIKIAELETRIATLESKP